MAKTAAGRGLVAGLDGGRSQGATSRFPPVSGSRWRGSRRDESISACGNSTGALSRVRVTDQNAEGSAVMTDDFARSISMRRCRWAGRSATRSGLQFRLVSGGFFISTIAEFGASFPENKLHSPRTPFRRSCRTLRSFRATANAQRLGNFSTSETKICLRRSQPRHSCMLKKSAPHTLV